jgi:calcineurin-like phosphoesterase family protein
MLKFVNGDNLYFSSDLHINHVNICYSTSSWNNKETSTRKFDSINQMNEAILCNINKIVDFNDHLFLLGDHLFRFKSVKDYETLFNRFICNNIYILFGNHCNRNNLKETCNNLEKIKFIGDYLEIEVGGKLLCMFHYPVESWNDRHQTSYMLHGHEHGKNRTIPRRLDVGIDNYFKLFGSYKPFSWKEIQKILI